jgi:hypothetical protein
LNPDVIPARGGNRGALGCCAIAQLLWIPAWRGNDDTESSSWKGAPQRGNPEAFVRHEVATAALLPPRDDR